MSATWRRRNNAILTVTTDPGASPTNDADRPLPEYDEFVEYCEYVELSCLEHDLCEQITEHHAIDEL